MDDEGQEDAASGLPRRPMLLPSGAGHELVEPGSRLLADGGAEGRRPAENEALGPERLARPAVEVEAVALLGDQPAGEAELERTSLTTLRRVCVNV